MKVWNVSSHVRVHSLGLHLVDVLRWIHISRSFSLNLMKESMNLFWSNKHNYTHEVVGWLGNGRAQWYPKQPTIARLSLLRNMIGTNYSPVTVWIFRKIYMRYLKVVRRGKRYKSKINWKTLSKQVLFYRGVTVT